MDDVAVGSRVAAPFGLDEIEMTVVELYESGGVQRARLGGNESVGIESLVLPVALLRLLPAKPTGHWARSGGGQ